MDFYPVQVPQESMEPPKRFERFFSRNSLIWSGVAVVVIALIVIGVVSLVRNQKTEVREVREDIGVYCDSQECEAVTATDMAKDQNDVTICRAVRDDENSFESCVKRYAYEQIDPSACTLLRGEVAETCADNTYVILARRDKDIASCDFIKVDTLRDICIAEQMEPYIRTGNCDLNADMKQLCLQKLQDRIDLAKTIGEDLCDPYMDDEFGMDSERYVLCQRVIDTIDLDNDGLVIRREIELGTDNQNPDTDGDGYNDGIEVQNGYNPLGV